MKKLVYIFVFLVFSAVFSSTAKAATLNILSDNNAYPIDKEFNVDIKIESEDQGVNGAQATLQFDKTVLEAVRVDKSNSIFDFWLTEPTISNESGQISFIAASTKGYSGKSLEILTVTFKPRGAGKTNLSFADAAVTAADGSGTNVLSKLNGLELNFSVTEAISKGPQQIQRAPEKASGLPGLPAISVPLYPDPAKWSDASARFFVSWKLPLDINGVAMVLNKIPIFSPDISEGLFDSKEFSPLKDGVYYLHARFSNGIGWGQTLHYRIAVDTSPPLPFKTEIDNAASDNPSPRITFNVHDALSGISRALVLVDNKEVFQTASTTVVLPTVEPGAHTLRVRVFDRAGNSIEDNLKFEIVPLPTPTLEFLSKSVTLEEPVFALGKSIPGAFIEARVLDASRQEVFKNTSQSDSSGNWKVTVDKSLHTGNYTFLVTARDERGASSYPTKEESFKVRPQTVLSFGGFIDLGWFEIFLIAMLIIISAASIIAWWYVSKKKTQEAYKIIVGRDIEKLSALLSDHLKEIEGMQELHDPSRSTHAAEHIERMKETISKMKKYIGEEVEKLT